MVQHQKYGQELNPSPYESTGTNPEQKLIQKLATLEKELARQQPEAKANEPSETDGAASDDGLSGEVDRLQSMMEAMGKPADEDPEMKQISGTLEKILDIQHPERVKKGLKINPCSRKSLYLR
jgi:hypothetical protein